MKTLKTVAAAVALTAAALTPNLEAHAADPRSAVAVAGHAVRAVTVGPALLHGYSGFSGGALFLAQKQTGTDADCAAALASPGARPMALVPDRVVYVPVGAGQVACLVTDSRRPFELLWHAFDKAPNETYVAHVRTGSTIR
jgi:hypothetical protein